MYTNLRWFTNTGSTFISECQLWPQLPPAPPQSSSIVSATKHRNSLLWDFFLPSVVSSLHHFTKWLKEHRWCHREGRKARKVYFAPHSQTQHSVWLILRRQNLQKINIPSPHAPIPAAELYLFTVADIWKAKQVLTGPCLFSVDPLVWLLQLLPKYSTASIFIQPTTTVNENI